MNQMIDGVEVGRKEGGRERAAVDESWATSRCTRVSFFEISVEEYHTEVSK